MDVPWPGFAVWTAATIVIGAASVYALNEWVFSHWGIENRL